MADLLNKLNSANYVTVKVTDNAIVNGNNLLAAYALAKTVTPNAIALSTSNRLAVILPPAKYDLGTQSLILDTQYIDIVGSTSDRSKHYITSNVDQANRGTIQQTANNVKLYNLTIENSNVTYANSGNSTDPAGYFPSSNLANAYLENIKIICPDDINDNQHSFSTRIGITYSGTYIDCSGGNYLFGGVVNSGSTTLSGIFTNCTGDVFSFGGIYFGGTSLLSGTFTNCRGSSWAFGGAYNHTAGTLSGTFIDCTSSDSLTSFGSASGTNGGGGTLSGTFTNCTGGFGAGGNESGGGNLTSTSVFTNCTGGSFSFAGGGAAGGTISGTLTNCTGGDRSFGGGDVSGGAISSTAVLENCTGGNFSFGGGGSDGGTLSGTFKGCTGGSISFGGGSNTNGGTISGTFTNCTGGIGSFNL